MVLLATFSCAFWILPLSKTCAVSAVASPRDTIVSITASFVPLNRVREERRVVPACELLIEALPIRPIASDKSSAV